MTIQLKFVRIIDTPGTVKFIEPPTPDKRRPAVGTLYVTKEALGEGWPEVKSCTVTIEVDVE